jgi:sporulation protein YunB
MNIRMKFKIGFFVSIILTVFIFFIYTFDKVVTPTILTVADGEIRAKTMEIINTCILEEYSNNFDYDSIIKVDKDDTGNIVMLKADTLKLSQIASRVSLKAQNDIKALGSVGLSLPIGYIFKNNILSNFGPRLTIKMQPIGHIQTLYSSEFETAGINQTRHKIYVQMKTHVRVIIPLASNDIEVRNEIPISETIIVGKIPNTAINLDLQRAGFMLPNK